MRKCTLHSFNSYNQNPNHWFEGVHWKISDLQNIVGKGTTGVIFFLLSCCQLHRVLQKKAGMNISRLNNFPRNSEYQSQFVWKSPHEKSPILAAEQVTLKNPESKWILSFMYQQSCLPSKISFLSLLAGEWQTWMLLCDLFFFPLNIQKCSIIRFVSLWFFIGVRSNYSFSLSLVVVHPF